MAGNSSPDSIMGRRFVSFRLRSAGDQPGVSGCLISQAENAPVAHGAAAMM